MDIVKLLLIIVISLFIIYKLYNESKKGTNKELDRFLEEMDKNSIN